MIELLSSISHPLSLPIQAAALADDSLPNLDEITHWSARVSHAAAVAGIALGVALALHFALFWMLQLMFRRGDHEIESLAAARLKQSTRWAMAAGALGIADDFSHLLAKVWGPLAQFAVPAITGWVLYALAMIFAELLARHAARDDDELSSRSRRTRITVLSRAVGFVIIFVTIALMLITIPAVKHIGTTLMASAGLLGLAFGAAAQPALKSLIAGLQIVLTEPIRIGDYVVVDGEQGRIEDIRLSYVVVRTVDERRLIVPTTKILDSTFQNWTRVGGITGSVVVPIRAGFAIEPIRVAFLAALAQRSEWDMRTGDLVVSEVRVGSVELKLIMSAADPADLSTLRLAMREALLEWLREHAPEALCTDV